MSVTLEEAFEIAKEAFDKSPDKSLGRMKCRSCIRKWRMEGGEQEKSPPSFPADYKGNCPLCGGSLYFSSCGF